MKTLESFEYLPLQRQLYENDRLYLIEIRAKNGIEAFFLDDMVALAPLPTGLSQD